MIYDITDVVGQTFMCKSYTGESEVLITSIAYFSYPQSSSGDIILNVLNPKGETYDYSFRTLIDPMVSDLGKKYFDIQAKFIAPMEIKKSFMYDMAEELRLISNGRLQFYNNYKLWFDNGDIRFYKSLNDFMFLPHKKIDFSGLEIKQIVYSLEETAY